MADNPPKVLPRSEQSDGHVAVVELTAADGRRVHEFMSPDSVIDAPTWTHGYGFLPEMEETIGAVTNRCRGILLGRTTYEMFEPAWSTRTVEEDPGAPFFNETTKYVVSATLTTASGHVSISLAKSAYTAAQRRIAASSMNSSGPWETSRRPAP